MQAIAIFFEYAGVATIVGGFLYALVRVLNRTLKEADSSYDVFRATFGRSVLLGLEILVAADLIRTVAVAPTLQNLAVLAALVGIRTFLSWSLEVEIDGRWPWHRNRGVRMRDDVHV
jgi:uncharacterized membrane protein